MRSVGLIAVPVLAVLGLLAGFALSLSAASRAFEHGLIAQRQAALVEAIAADADRLDQASLQRRLAAYRALVVEERPFLSAADAAAQGAEQRRAAALSALAGVAADRPRMAALVAAIAAEEAHEVAATRAGLARLRRNMVVLGALLAAAALGAVAAGALQMLRANRDLAGQVAERTAALEAVDASRRLFFAKASHELRTPVTAIRTIAEVAQEGADQAQALADIVAQAGFLEHRIADLMALAAAGEGQPALVLAPGDLAGVIAGAAA
ncbi:MAG TPA: histidine kinase dimerization/phospho-acceptor domain-containing protein, partial [Novosphingobium sp.]|nr:histidine kinase dimerization/phospho-acceptor domain-containing protein [Novosphingobium sp.]